MRCHHSIRLTHGKRCPMNNLDVLSCTVRPKAVCQSIRKADNLYRSLFTTPGMDRCEAGIING